jgi:hypothetical protein
MGICFWRSEHAGPSQPRPKGSALTGGKVTFGPLEHSNAPQALTTPNRLQIAKKSVCSVVQRPLNKSNYVASRSRLAVHANATRQ